MKQETKALWTLCVDDYAPEITSLTFPAMEKWAHKIGAEFHVIEERKYPDFPPVYEKLQIHELGRDYDWNLYIDADAIVNHIEMFDPTDHLSKNEVLHWGSDMAGNRWRYDEYFRRDARHIGSGNWFTVASNWCLDLWHPLEDLTLEQACENIYPTVHEQRNGIKPSHLIDDYTLSRNIARYGLKLFTFVDLLKAVKRESEATNTYFFHSHLLTREQKHIAVQEILLRDWNPNPSPWDAAMQLIKLQAVGRELESTEYVKWFQPTKFLFRDGDDIHVEVPSTEVKTVLESKRMSAILKRRITHELHFHIAGSKRIIAA